jgi:hypothetical protein
VREVPGRRGEWVVEAWVLATVTRAISARASWVRKA